MEELIRIEVVPWIKEYETDMVDLYTEPTLEKVKNKPQEQSLLKLKNFSGCKRKKQEQRSMSMRGICPCFCIKHE